MDTGCLPNCHPDSRVPKGGAMTITPWAHSPLPEDSALPFLCTPQQCLRNSWSQACFLVWLRGCYFPRSHHHKCACGSGAPSPMTLYLTNQVGLPPPSPPHMLTRRQWSIVNSWWRRKWLQMNYFLTFPSAPPNFVIGLCSTLALPSSPQRLIFSFPEESSWPTLNPVVLVRCGIIIHKSHWGPESHI